MVRINTIWKTAIIAGLILSGSTHRSVAQNGTPPVYFERIGERQGFNSSSIAQVFQDSQGFLWICTVSGVYRYDGVHLKDFRSDPEDPDGLSIDFVKNIAEDPEGRLWAITQDNQLHVYQHLKAGFRRKYFYTDQPEKEPLTFNQLVPGPEGAIWAISKRHGLIKLDPEADTLLPTGLPRDITAGATIMAADLQNGHIWIVSNSKLYRIRVENNQHTIQTYPKVKLTRVNALLPGASGGVWIAGYMDDILYVNAADELPVAYPYKRPNETGGFRALNRVNTLEMDPDGRIWAGTNHTGVIVIDPATGQRTVYAHVRGDPKSLSSNTVTSILKDRSGIIWVATWGAGLHKFNSERARFGHYQSIPDVPNSLSNPGVTTFCEDRDGNIWIGTNDGLNKLDKASGRIERYDLPAAPVKNWKNEIYSIQTGGIRDRQLWIGTTLGLWRFDPVRKQFSKWRAPAAASESLEKNMVYYLTKDREGNLWAISYWPYRLFIYEERSADFRQVDPIGKMAFTGEPVFSVDGHHNVWIGTQDNIFYKYSLNEQKLYPVRLHPEDASGFNTRDIGLFYLGGNKRMWIGTQFGLFSMDLDPNGQPLPARRFTEKDGLPNNQIVGILEDQGYLWLSTNNGLSRFDPRTNTFRNFTRSDGLQANEFSYGACFKSPSTGALLFGGTNGFNMFVPSTIRNDDVAPGVAITGINVVRGSEAVDLPFNPLLHQQQPSLLHLNYAERVITIQFAALHFADPDRNRFAYIMEGFDKDWRFVASPQQATYTNLDPGLYTFRVKAANKDGVWNETGTSLSIRVLPPWWKSWWAYCCYVALFAGGVLSFVRYQKKRQEERSDARRIAELDALRTRLYTNITHEFRTPLTVISGMADTIETPASARELIQKNARGLLHLVNQILDLSKLESGQLKLDLIQTDIVPLLHNIAESFRPFAEIRQIDLLCYTEPDQLVMDVDDHKLLTILSNLISNAIKFTPAGGQIFLFLQEQDGQMVLKVKDSGVGIPPEKLPMIFDRFYQADEAAIRKGEGSGIGLTLSKELVERMGGTIQAKSQPGKGAEFTITLPVTRNAPAGKPSVAWNTELPAQNLGITDADAAPGGLEGLPILLLIEDHADVAFYIQTCLHGNYQVIVARDGAEGIRQALSLIPDIIISDVMMPEKDGYEVCRTLKEDERSCHIPIILLTAKADLPSRLEGLNVGADAYLSKPFSKEELLIRIEKLLALRKTLQRHYSGSLYTAGQPESGFSRPSLDEQFLEKVRHWLETNYTDEDFGNAQLASRLQISESQLFRKLKALTGQSTAVYIRSFRLHKARYLLETTGLTAAEIAYEVGFSDPAYFSRTFVQEFGSPPNAIRKS